MTTLTPSVFSPDSTVGEIVAAHPAIARLFEHLGIDYCCGGKQPLAEACAEKNLDFKTTLALLESASTALGSSSTEVDAASMSLTQLADHIESTHHAYLKTELPRLMEMAAKVAAKHSHRDPRLPEMNDLVQSVSEEMLEHMEMEEVAFFPLVRRIDAGIASDEDRRRLEGPVRQLVLEHDAAGQAVARLRELTNGFTPDEESCNTQRALLAGLASFEADLHRHVHKENNILFPRTLERASA